MSDCRTERDTYAQVMFESFTAWGIAIAGAPETFGASLVVIAGTGMLAGAAMDRAKHAYLQCLRSRGKVAQADTLEQAHAQLEAEAAQMVQEAQAALGHA